MSSNKLVNISNGYITHCGINRWDESIEKKRVVDYMYLDNHLKGTSQSQKRMRFVIGS
jgi:hypothetical protein